MIIRFSTFLAGVGALGLLLGDAADAFTVPTTTTSSRTSFVASTTRLAQQQQQFYDANGNPVSMPMVYDANGNPIPFNTMQQQPAQQMQQPTPQVVNPSSFDVPIVEPPLPPKTKGTNDDPRPTGRNPDAYTMSNTADVYFAQLKQDSKVRKLARLSGDIETANKVFADDRVRQIADSWNENPYTREQNMMEARAQIEGTVRMQVAGGSGGDNDDNNNHGGGGSKSGISYRQKLEEMKAKRGGGVGVGVGGEGGAVSNIVVPPPPKVGQTIPTNVVPVTKPPPPVAPAAAAPKIEQQQTMMSPPKPITPPSPPSQVVQPIQKSATPAAAAAAVPVVVDPLAGSVACVEAALKMYKDSSSPGDRETMMIPLREALMAAASQSNKVLADLEEKEELEVAAAAQNNAGAAAAVASTPPPPVQQQEMPAAQQQPMMGFPTSYAVTKPGEEEEQSATAPVAATEKKMESSIAEDAPDAIMQLQLAASKLDAKTVSNLLEAGYAMDEETTDTAFWAVVNAVDRAEALDKPLPAEVPQMLHHIFDADLRHLLTREQVRTNVTCMQPQQEGANRIGMNYIFDDSAHKDLPLEEGRRCDDGTCCEACSRNIFPTFATDAESNFDTFVGINSLTFNDLEKVSAATIIQFVRLIERVRRTIAHEYGLELKTILPLQAYSRKYVAGSTQQGGGGGEGDFVILHTDEATHSGYHYSCVMYLSTQGVDFEGGDFVFNDPLAEGEAPDPEIERMSLEEQRRRTGRKLTPFHPTKGAAVIFSSGWENMHEVEKITSGVRYAVPAFFTTSPVPDAAYDQMVAGKPKTDEDIADDWLHLLLAHRKESPVEAAGRVRELLMKWHYMCAPLSLH